MPNILGGFLFLKTPSKQLSKHCKSVTFKVRHNILELEMYFNHNQQTQKCYSFRMNLCSVIIPSENVLFNLSRYTLTIESKSKLATNCALTEMISFCGHIRNLIHIFPKLYVENIFQFYNAVQFNMCMAVRKTNRWRLYLERKGC